MKRVATLEKRYQDRYGFGAIVTEHGFTSASRGEEFRGNTHWIIHGKTGRLVERLSAHEHETEVLFPPGTRFRVHRRTEHPGYVEITIEEIDDP